jgi:hypothetical protein
MGKLTFLEVMTDELALRVSLEVAEAFLAKVAETKSLRSLFHRRVKSMR